MLNFFYDAFLNVAGRKMHMWNPVSSTFTFMHFYSCLLIVIYIEKQLIQIQFQIYTRLAYNIILRDKKYIIIGISYVLNLLQCFTFFFYLITLATI